MTVDELPDEILVEIFKYAGQDHVIGGLSQTCRIMRRISMENSLWKPIYKPLYTAMWLDKVEISRIEHFRTEYFCQRSIDAAVSALTDSIVYRQVGDNDKVDSIVRKIFDYGRAALPVLDDMRYPNPRKKTLTHAYYAETISAIIIRYLGVEKLINLCVSPKGHHTIDLILGMSLLCTGHLEYQAFSALYGDTLEEIRDTVQSTRRSNSPVDTCQALNTTLKTVGVENCLHFMRDRGFGGFVAASMYSHVAKYVDLSANTLVTPYWTFVIVDDEASKDGLFLVDVDNNYRIRDLDSIPFLSKMLKRNLTTFRQCAIQRMMKIIHRDLDRKANHDDMPKLAILRYFLTQLFPDICESYGSLGHADPVNVFAGFPFHVILLEKTVERFSGHFPSQVQLQQCLDKLNPKAIVPKPRPAENDPVNYRIGQLCQRYSSSTSPCIIIGWDKVHRNPSFSDNEPFYSVWLNGDVLYLRQSSLSLWTKEPKFEFSASNEISLGKYFTKFDSQGIVPSVELQMIYPDG